MNVNKQKLLAAALAIALGAGAALAQTPYDEGQKALREGRWTDAARLFEDAEADPAQAAAAMYWRAHALYKGGRHADAARQVVELERKHPDSRWAREAQALTIEYQQGARKQEPLDDEMRLFALSRLMERDPERAMPLVMDMLREAESDDVRRDAMFLLGMSELPAAHQAVAEFARSSSDPRLQAQAIDILGVAGSPESLALLSELYDGASTREVKRAIIHAHIAADEPGRLAELLRSETDPGLQRDMLHALGAMDATDRLDAIYPGLTDPEAKRAAIEAFSIAGDIDRLQEVAASETDPELQHAAITGIAVTGDDNAVDLLRTIYANASEQSVRSAVVEALVILGEGEDFALEIVRSDPDPEIRRQAIHVLGLTDATDRLAELYAGMDDRDTREAVLEALMMADDIDGLVHIVETESDPELRGHAIRTLAVTDDERAAETLFSIYPGASREDKQAVIESMLIMDDAGRLVQLLEQEEDPELKRHMLQTLSAIDSEEADEYLFQALERDR